MKIENPYYSTSSLPTYTHVYWQDDEIHVSSLSLLLKKKKMKTTGHHFATNTSPTLLSTHTHTKNPPGQTDRQPRSCCLLSQTLQRKIGCFWRPQPASSLPLYPYLGTEVTPEIPPKRFCRRPKIWKKEKKGKCNQTRLLMIHPISPHQTNNKEIGKRKKKKEKPTWGKVARICSRRAGYVPFQLPCEYTWGVKRSSFGGGKGMNG